MKTLKEVLMSKFNMTSEEAEQDIEFVKGELYSALALGEMPFDICEEYWGLEPDYLDELI